MKIHTLPDIYYAQQVNKRVTIKTTTKADIKRSFPFLTPVLQNRSIKTTGGIMSEVSTGYALAPSSSMPIATSAAPSSDFDPLTRHMNNPSRSPQHPSEDVSGAPCGVRDAQEVTVEERSNAAEGGRDEHSIEEESWVEGLILPLQEKASNEDLVSPLKDTMLNRGKHSRISAMSGMSSEKRGPGPHMNKSAALR